VSRRSLIAAGLATAGIVAVVVTGALVAQDAGVTVVPPADGRAVSALDHAITSTGLPGGDAAWDALGVPAGTRAVRMGEIDGTEYLGAVAGPGRYCVIATRSGAGVAGSCAALSGVTDFAMVPMWGPSWDGTVEFAAVVTDRVATIRFADGTELRAKGNFVVGRVRGARPPDEHGVAPLGAVTVTETPAFGGDRFVVQLEPW